MWNWKRIGCLAGGLLVGAVGVIFPPAAVYAMPIATKLFIAGGAGMLVGVAIKTPGHVPAPTNPHDEDTAIIPRT